MYYFSTSYLHLSLLHTQLASQREKPKISAIQVSIKRRLRRVVRATTDFTAHVITLRQLIPVKEERQPETTFSA